ncbi:hypothetical protein [Psychroflexus sediminis]|uniref:Uncharacterized protein n=1 Tax=Psychroflexus sediminis TaxID=470826 RepID=A0A1G7XYQ9_9FLAO|nr:hypothetical protein [Psychroflexus sediminis]SDG89297.1 hypothetical protein SAMN04488027_11028 [Psychroflexus sediminis]
MKRFIFLLAGFVFFTTPVWANHSGYEIDSRSNNWNNSQNQPFIFMENGIEFSVFQDGQFDFFIPNYGPNVSVGFNIANVNFSFNSGYDYNPYVQYDDYGAIIQIQNTPVFYDYYGRIHQIGNIVIDYNTYGLVSRIGGLQLFYRNHRVWRQSGFINHSNRRYVRRPWHRYYAMPVAQFSLVSLQPYRQFYRPVRHIYYRPYANNFRDFDLNRRHSNARQRTHNTRSQRYTQSPRNRMERDVRSNVQRRHKSIQSMRNSRVSTIKPSNKRNSRSISERNNRTRREVTSRATRKAREIDYTNRRSPVSRQARRNMNADRSGSLNLKKNEQARTHDRKANEVSGRTSNRNAKVNRKTSRRNSVQTKPSSYNRSAHKTERGSRPKGNTRGKRSRNR